MTDNEIVKALPFIAKYCKREYNDIRVDELLLGALDLINRQKSEIERLEKDSKRLKKVEMQLDDAMKMYDTIKAEAIKEFADRLKENSIATFSWNGVVLVEEIDNLVKEMAGDNDE